MATVGLTGDVTFEQKPERDEETSHADVRVLRLSMSGYSRKLKEGSAGTAECARRTGREVRDEVGQTVQGILRTVRFLAFTLKCSSVEKEQKKIKGNKHTPGTLYPSPHSILTLKEVLFFIFFCKENEEK